MNLSILEKPLLVFRNAFSSFLGIELFILTLLFFWLLILNVNRKSKIICFSLSFALIIFLGMLIYLNLDYVVYCFDSFVKCMMNYIYFPSTVAYFLIMLIVTILLIYTIFSKKMTKLKKIVNLSLFGIIYFFYLQCISVIVTYKIDIMDKVSLYKNDVILSAVQITNAIFIVWLVFTFFYRLFQYFKNRFD